MLSGKQDSIVYGAFCGKISPSCGPHTETRVEKDVTMDNGNGSTPERRQGKGHSVRHWPCAASSSGNREKLSLNHLDEHRRGGHHCPAPICMAYGSSLLCRAHTLPGLVYSLLAPKEY